MECRNYDGQPCMKMVHLIYVKVLRAVIFGFPVQHDKILKQGGHIMKRYLLFIMLIVLSLFAVPQTARAGENMAGENTDGWKNEYSNLQKDKKGNAVYVSYLDDEFFPGRILHFDAHRAAENGAKEVRFTSSDPNVCSVDEEYARVDLQNYVWQSHIEVKLIVKNCGRAVITAKVGDKKYSFIYAVVPTEWADVTAIRTVGYNTVKLRWKKNPAATGYAICSGDADEPINKTKVVKRVHSASALSAVVKVTPGSNCRYIVVPVIKGGVQEYGYFPKTAFYMHGDANTTYTHNYTGAKITGLSVSGSRVTVKWKADSQAKYYKVYHKTREDGSWKLMHTEKNASKTRYSVKLTPGYTHIFKVVYKFKDGSCSTANRSCYIKKKTTTIKKKINTRQTRQEGQYRELFTYATRPDETYYYEKNKVLHTVVLSGQKLIDYTMTASGGVKSRKTIKLCKFGKWGGFYYGPDGCYYVALGYENVKNKNSNTVIKVLKYSKDWKLQKTCRIKGASKYISDGIAVPFYSGNCRMTMHGTKLYMIASRLMFNGHQANMQFIIDTKTMRYRATGDNYTSHSFNQLLRFDGDTLYLSNHGDAMPRGVSLTQVTDYGTSNENKTTKVTFEINGQYGDNYTGLFEGGMETTSKNILIAGTSVPQGYTVAGVSGSGSNLAKNVFVIVTNKKTMKSNIKWITKNNPEKTKVKLSEVRMVKISDDYVALMYTSTVGKRSVLNYVVLNADGKAVYKKKYNNMVFTGATQPVLYRGAIVWTDVKETKKLVSDPWYSYYKSSYTNYYYKIPVITGK